MDSLWTSLADERQIGRPDRRNTPPGPLRSASEASSRLRLRLIGQMAASAATGPVELPRVRKTRALLAILVLAGGRPVLRERVASLLWSTREREQARASLRQCVHELQEFCTVQGLARLRTGRQHLILDTDLIWVDVFAIATATASQADRLGLLQGEFLEDLIGLDSAFDAWIADEARRLRDTGAALAGMVLDRQTEPEAMIRAARQLVGLAPGNEAGWQRLIQAYAASGERAAAFDAYDRCAQALAQSSGRSPSPETQALRDSLTSLEVPRPLDPAPKTALDPAIEPPSRRRDAGLWLAVNGFRCTDPHDELGLALELAEDLAAALARFRWLNLIAPGGASDGTMSAGRPDRSRTSEADLLLDGAIQRRTGAQGGLELRITIRLLDLRAGGEMVWSRRFDGDADHLSALQDSIVAQTAAQVDAELLLHESRRVQLLPIATASATDLMLRAIPSIFRLVEPDYTEAGRHLGRASEMAPDNATILGWHACWNLFLIGQSLASNVASTMQEAGQLAERAVALDPGCARALSVAAHVRSFLLHKSIAETIGLHERALALNPNLPFAWAVACLSLSYAGEHDLAVARGEQARLLSPFDPHSFFFDGALMVPRMMRHEYDEVVALGRRSLALNPAMIGTMKGLLSALGLMGRLDDAAELRAKLLARAPGLTVASAMARSALRRTQDRELYATGLLRAGLPAE